MQITSAQYPSSSADGYISSNSVLQEHDSAGAVEWQSDTMIFEGDYVGEMQMNADARTVASYLDAHRNWFSRCAQPMKVESIGETASSRRR